jgi:prepilin peptidase CpaA
VCSILCAVLFYLNVFGGGDAKVIAAASLWTGLAASAPFVMGMAIAGGALAGRAYRPSPDESAKRQAVAGARLMSPEEGAPYAVAIADGALCLRRRHRPCWRRVLRGEYLSA